MSGTNPQVLALNRTRLPAEALFLIRHQRFHALHRPGQPYDELLCDADRNMVRPRGQQTLPRTPSPAPMLGPTAHQRCWLQAGSSSQS